ncbi:MAG: type II secretion system F family protein [bacterium]|nr:type II secretion system F family protein [bacterium]
MKFNYIASYQNGKITEGTAEAESTAQLLQILAAKGLRPVSVKPVKSSDIALSGTHHVFGQKITIADQIFLTKYLSIMLKVGTDLFQAINILIADFEKPALRALLIEIRETLEKGQPFYSTFARYPQYFSPVFVNLVKAGEGSGNLEHVFEELSVSLDKERELRSKIKGAMIYPILLLSLSLVILIFLTTFALPKLANVFTGGGFEPPGFSRVVFAVGLFINKYIWVFAGVFGAFAIGVWLFSKSLAGKRAFSAIRIRLPIVGKIAFKIALQRFAATLSSLLKAGVPILQAIEITANAVGHPNLHTALLRVRDGVSQGLTLGEGFKKESALPAVVTNLIAISEKAGHLDEILVTMSHFYETEIEGSIKSAVTFIEPIMLLFIGGIIGMIALAIIVPVYQLVGQL